MRLAGRVIRSVGEGVADSRDFLDKHCGRLCLQVGAVAVAGLCAGMAGAAGLTCEHAAGVDDKGAGRLCQAVAAALMEGALPVDGLTLEVVKARADLVAARLHRNGDAGPLVQVLAMDGPLQPDWPARLAADLLRAAPPP